jgi:hypothetical protein
MADEETTIGDLIAAAGRPGHAHMKAVIGDVSDWLVREARNHGIDVAGFQHTVDTSSVRHILSHHGNKESENRRGRIAVVFADLHAIPDVLATPDKIIFGATNSRKQQLVAYIKRMPDDFTLYIQEVRAGRRKLATTSMRKYPTTIDADRLATNFDLYGRTDGGDETYSRCARKCHGPCCNTWQAPRHDRCLRDRQS